MAPNQLLYGDNLKMLRQHVKDETVDLIYLDPPFKSSQDYNVLFREHSGGRSTAQIQAFEDTWHWDEQAVHTYREVAEAGGHVSEALQAFHRLVGENDMLAYLTMMAPRLKELHRVLKPTGSLYLHCDPTASHYLKLLLDAVFGAESYLNEIIWKRTGAHSSAKRYGPVHDVLLFYGKTRRYTWSGLRTDYQDAYLDKYYRYDDGDGRLYWRNSLTAAGVRNGSSGLLWRGIDVAATGQHWKFTRERLDQLDADGRIYWPPRGGFPQIKRYRDELKGKAVGDIWDDIDHINPVGAERLGYQTQKPVALLERILSASSHPGDVVLDPFCGCGTAIAAAQKLGRQWIGIDITCLATNLIKNRLKDTFGDAVQYTVHGEPTSLFEAAELARTDPYQFQWWALGLVGARGVDQKKGADRGIDGRLYFHDDAKGTTKQIILSVKAGHTGVAHMRDLRGVIEREQAEIGALLTMQEPTAPMRAEAAGAGFYESPAYGRFPRLQVISIARLLLGERLLAPPSQQTNITFKRAPKARAAAIVPPTLPLDGAALTS